MEKLVIKSLEFWKTVREEYLTSKQEFVCNGSKTFSNAWNQHIQELYDISEAFVKTNTFAKEYGKIYTGMGFLFILVDPLLDRTTMNIQIRKQFLTWCVEQYNN